MRSFFEWKLVLAICLLLCTYCMTAFAQFSPSRIRLKITSPFNMVATNEVQNQIVIIGQISHITVGQIKIALETLPKAKELVIDSVGGDVESAIEIARLVRDKNLALVVDGRCFSACANFIFVAAKHKRVLPGSLVGIHHATTRFAVQGRVKEVLERSDLQKLPATEMENGRRYFETSHAKMQEFFKEFNVNQTYLQQFSSYISARRRLVGEESFDIVRGYPACPRIDMWILDEQKLKQMGVQGIDEFWYPKDDLVKKKLFSNLQLSPDTMYFGDDEKLSTYCKEFLIQFSIPAMKDFKTFVAGL